MRNPDLCEFVFCRQRWDYRIEAAGTSHAKMKPVHFCAVHAKPYLDAEGTPANYKKKAVVIVKRAS